MTEAAYALSAEVDHGRLQRQDALSQLAKQYGLNSGSASDHIVNFKKMMDGIRYTRTNNAEATEYYLTNILKDYGPERLKLAIKAANEHVEYYEGLGRGNLNGIRNIIRQHEKYLSTADATIFPDELPQNEKLFEGLKKQITVNSYERNQVARNKCIQHYGFKCVVCDFDFEKVFGEIGKGFIHVHHLTQISTIAKGYEVDPVKDLRPVCPNCHAMLHRKKPSLSINELKNIIR